MSGVPPGLCRAICRGLNKQMQADSSHRYLLATVEIKDKFPHAPEEPEDIQWHTYWDNISGEILDGKLVKKARFEEVDYIRGSKLYNPVPIEECWRVTGKKAIAGRWVDINKGDDIDKQYGSRWVAKDYTTKADPDMFAATPPLEALERDFGQ